MAPEAAYLTVAVFALLLLLLLVVADAAARAILRLAVRWEPLRRAVRWVTAEDEPDHRGAPTGEHRAVAKKMPGGLWLAACECGWFGDWYAADDYEVASAARTMAMLEALEHVKDHRDG